MARASTFTLLPLDEFARIAGINPVFFQGAQGQTIWPFSDNRCNDLWPSFDWQYSDTISRESLAEQISDAEETIARYLHYWPAPRWTYQEVHPFPRHHRRDVWRIGGLDVRGARVGVTLNYGKVISPGRRAVSLVGTATTAGGTLVYSDSDGDGFFETATITLPTTLTNACEIKAYFAGNSGAQEWEIRPARSKTLTGGNIVLVYDSWLFINPDLQDAYPTTSGFSGIDISTTANYVTSVDVYREYNDVTQASVVYYWEPDPPWQTGFVCASCGGTGCTACQLTTQDGCFHIRDAELGTVVPTPATYSNSAWSSANPTVCRDPDQVKFYYYSGDLSNQNLASATCREMPNWLARTITYLAIARMERPFCNCGVAIALWNKMQVDLAFNSPDGSATILSDKELDNPFGTRFGEINAYRRLSKFTKRRMTGVAV